MSSADLNETHDASLRSWIDSANAPDTDFPVQNLPFGIFRRQGGEAQAGVAIGDQIFDLAAGVREGLFDGDALIAAQAASGSKLNALMALQPSHVSALRRRLSQLLRAGGAAEPRLRGLADRLLVPMQQVEMDRPAEIGGFTDFSCSMHHMSRMGGGTVRQVFMHLPVGYNGRASSVVATGAEVLRPSGQWAGEDGSPTFGPEPRLDFELEFAAFIGAGNRLGRPIPIADAEAHIFGYVLLNDWSARAMQMFEMALGPFLGKSFLTTVSPWVVTREAMAPFRTPAFPRPAEDPAPPSVLDDPTDRREGGLDVRLEAFLSTAAMRSEGLSPKRIVSTNFRHIYWTFAQMLAHHTTNGCDMRPGDLIASGTVSGPADEAKACLMEANERGTRPLDLGNGETRLWLQDGDELSIRGRAERDGFVPIGFGACDGRVVAGGSD